MNEENNVKVEEVTTDVENTQEVTEELQKKSRIKQLIQYIKEHEDIRQMVVFFLFSCICGATQTTLTYGLSLLRYAGGVLAESFPGFMIGELPLFRYDSHAEFIGFLVGSVAGQVLTFVLNRKKTFNIKDHVAFRAVAYAIMAVLIIFMQVLVGGAITMACRNAKPDANEFFSFLFNLTGLCVGGILALVINFIGNKFFIMRKWPEKKAK